MKLITIGIVMGNMAAHANPAGNNYVERWLYSGGIKRFLANIQQKQIYPDFSPYLISVVDLGDVDNEEIKEMISDGYKFMPLEDVWDTLYKKK
jgi:hypothetical protein